MARIDVLAKLRHDAQASRFFDAGGPILFATAHGCLDVLGALEAEGGGTLAQMVLPGKVAVALQPRGDSNLRIKSAQIAAPTGTPEALFCLEELTYLSATEATRRLASAGQSTADNAWAAGLFALGWLLRNDAVAITAAGANILIHSDIPMSAGQASSTALLAATAQAFANARRLTPDTLALAQQIATAEALATGGSTGAPATPSRGHIIDALTCLHPHPPHPTLLRYSAQPHRLVGPVPLPPNVRVFALDTGVRYAGKRAALEELRLAAAMGLRIIETIYRDLGQSHTPLHGYLTNTSPLLYRQYFRTLLPKRLRGNDFVRTYGPLATGEGHDLLPIAPEELDTTRIYRVRTAVDHLIAENEHAEQFVQAMEELADEGDPGRSRAGTPPMEEAERQRTLQRAGRLLLASHHSYRLRLELSCREADWLVDHLMEAGPDRGVYGARITGAGGGGTVVALMDRSVAATDALLEAMKSYQQATGLTLGVTEA